MNVNLDYKECRICFDNEVDSEFINPCLCDGTSKYVHITCLERWRKINENKKAFEYCMECNYKYKYKYKYKLEKFIYNLNFNQKLYLLYAFSMPISIIYNYCDKYYSILSILDFGQTKITDKICFSDYYNNSFTCYETCLYKILDNVDYISKYLFYLSFVMIFNSIVLFIAYNKLNKKNINRYDVFYKINKKTNCLWFLNIFKFLIFYYNIVYLLEFPQGIFGYVYVNIFFEPFMYNKLIELHNSSIDRLNKQNPTTILPYKNDNIINEIDNESLELD